MRIIRHYYNLFKNRKSENWKEDKFTGRNIYNMKSFSDEMTFTHRILKRMFIVPAIMFLDWYFKGKLKNNVDISYQFRKVKAFDTAFDEALLKWNSVYRPYAYGAYSPPETFIDDGASKNLTLIKDMYMTILQGDTAYLEFHNFLMDEIRRVRVDEDKNHLLYTAKSIADHRYFIITDSIESGVINLSRVRDKARIEVR